MAFLFSINQIEMSGIYWLPIYKTGKCTYQVGVRSIVEPIVKNGEVVGNMSFAATGVSSVSNLQDQIMLSAAQSILKAAKN
jgi:hypothetical protein